ncbi:amidohydrolase family protein [Porcipelethomonas sp.]|uniref:amidohydrolase family protein n=1 Tax=Porcipelethomonas sp. TaxID=2981675 RepID=UPI003EF71588
MNASLTTQYDFIPVIDAHAHIFPDKIALKAMETVGRFYDLPMYTKGTLSELYAVRENAENTDRRIVMQLIFSPATEPEQTKSINDFIAGICSKDKSLTGFGTLHRDNDDFKSEIRRIQSSGLKGIKFHSDFQQFDIDDPKMLPIYKEAADNNLPVIFHMGDKKLDYSAVSRLKNVLDKIPELIVIAAHMGGYMHWQEAYDILPVSHRLYFDISSTLSFISDYELKKMIEKFGTDNFFFGSDFPMWNPNEELLKLGNMRLSEKVRRKIEYYNFLNFLNMINK